MHAEEHFAQAFSGEEARLGALELYLFELLTALALKFGFREGSFSRQLVDELQERLGKFGEACEGDGAGISARAGAEIGTESAQSFFDLAAGALRSAGARDGRGHVGKGGSALSHGGVPGSKEELAVESRDGVRLGEDNFKTVREAGLCAFWPGDVAFGGERRNSDGGSFGGSRGHYAASFAASGMRKTMARL